MPDYTELLSRLASAMEQIATSPNYYWVAPLAVLLSAFIGYTAAQRTIKKQREHEATKDRKKKELVFSLLKDEITLRWQGDIAPYVHELFRQEPISGLQRFSRMTLRADDLFVMSGISRSFSDYYFLEKGELVSKLIHGHLLYADFIDFQASVRRFLNEWTQRREALKASEQEVQLDQVLNQEYGKTVDDLWKRFQDKLDEMGKRFQSVLDDLR